MTEQHKQQLIKIQQANQRAAPMQNPQNAIGATGGQTNIMNYLTRQQKPNNPGTGTGVTGQQQPCSSKSNNDVVESVDADKKDEESQKGHFGKCDFFFFFLLIDILIENHDFTIKFQVGHHFKVEKYISRTFFDSLKSIVQSVWSRQNF